MTTTKTLPDDLIDQLLSGYKKPEDLIGENGTRGLATGLFISGQLQVVTKC